ncbi:beta-ketoadipate enol-lactone hydrolase [Ephemerocybe angulata]|uniref:Beta-ketoadipate enol-lactone hydrolase n=1 Tax=Ephemerocybe angulata TaxID=980116 RepID=A0A8H6MC59_9AGAR|nr:beta-ketoadipate enol-lactone hydrolase [Tulosesus angulatus]
MFRELLGDPTCAMETSSTILAIRFPSSTLNRFLSNRTDPSMSTTQDSPGTPSRLVAGRYPAPGTDPIADKIRERRGERGITPLDANLLHFPAMAAGYNDLLGALRTGGRLPGDVRELMILRIAALNKAAFEWIQHEAIGRTEGLSTGQLFIIRDTTTPLPPMPGMLSALQSVALQFTDAVTRDLNFSISLGQEYKAEIRKWLSANTQSASAEDLEKTVEDIYVEACMVVSGYNMVSRFLISTDVDGLTGKDVPWPLNIQELDIAVPSYSPTDKEQTHSIHTTILQQKPKSSPNARYAAPEWLLFLIPSSPPLKCGTTSPPSSLMATWPPYRSRQFNIILHDQRGHGRSGLPSVPNNSPNDPRKTTIPLLAQDIQALLLSPTIRELIDGGPGVITPRPLHSVIGVSQGGAAALAFAALQSNPESGGGILLTKSVVACDTAAKTPAGNKAAWADRVRLVHGDTSSSAGDAEPLSACLLSRNATVPRWFPSGSPIPHERSDFVTGLVEKTDVEGFVAGAQALGEYDLLAGIEKPLSDTPVDRVLLLAGSLDGGGKVGQGLRNLKAEWEFGWEG